MFQLSYSLAIDAFNISVQAHSVDDPTKLFATIVFGLIADNIISDAEQARNHTLKILGPLSPRRVAAETIVLAMAPHQLNSFTDVPKFLDCQILRIPQPGMIRRGVLPVLHSSVRRLDTWSDLRRSYGWINIVDKHLYKGRDVLACQEELIDNGFEELATM